MSGRANELETQRVDDVGCPVCEALPDEMCITAAGKIRNDHAARTRAALAASSGSTPTDTETPS